MAGLIKKLAKEKIYLLQRGAIEDGKPLYKRIATVGFVSNFSQSDFSHFGNIKSGKVVLVPPLDIEPELPAKLDISGVLYEVAGIKCYRNTRNEVVGYRIAIAGA
ncbi:MAG: hypothetical protein AB7F40_04360 [Victivallaceae bacterium]